MLLGMGLEAAIMNIMTLIEQFVVVVTNFIPYNVSSVTSNAHHHIRM